MSDMEGVSAGSSVLFGAQLTRNEVNSIPTLARQVVSHSIFQTGVVAFKMCGNIECHTQFTPVAPSPVTMLVSVAPSWPVILVTAISVREFSEPCPDQMFLQVW